MGVIDNAIKDVAKSRISWLNDQHTDFRVEEGVMIWTNFRGEPNRFGNDTANFNLVIPTEFADDLKKLGWNVKQKFAKDDNGNEIKDDVHRVVFINVKVKMDSKFPPIITLFKPRGNQTVRVTLADESAIKCLDTITINRADITVHGSYNENVRATIPYLKKLNVLEEIDGSEEYWDNLTNPGSDANDYVSSCEDDNYR